MLCSRKLQIFGGDRHVRELTQQSFRRLMLNTYVSLLEVNQKCLGSTKVLVLLQPFRIQKIHSIVCEDYYLGHRYARKINQISKFMLQEQPVIEEAVKNCSIQRKKNQK